MNTKEKINDMIESCRSITAEEFLTRSIKASQSEQSDLIRRYTGSYYIDLPFDPQYYAAQWSAKASMRSESLKNYISVDEQASSTWHLNVVMDALRSARDAQQKIELMKGSKEPVVMAQRACLEQELDYNAIILESYSNYICD